MPWTNIINELRSFRDCSNMRFVNWSQSFCKLKFLKKNWSLPFHAPHHFKHIFSYYWIIMREEFNAFMKTNINGTINVIFRHVLIIMWETSLHFLCTTLLRIFMFWLVVNLGFYIIQSSSINHRVINACFFMFNDSQYVKFRNLGNSINSNLISKTLNVL